jgi:hypothetical protein
LGQAFRRRVPRARTSRAGVVLDDAVRRAHARCGAAV